MVKKDKKETLKQGLFVRNIINLLFILQLQLYLQLKQLYQHLYRHIQ